MNELADRLRAALAVKGRPSSDFDLNPAVQLPEGRQLRDAAVLIPVVDRADGAWVILTKRSSALKHHPGQIAFLAAKWTRGMRVRRGPLCAKLGKRSHWRRDRWMFWAPFRPTKLSRGFA